MNSSRAASVSFSLSKFAEHGGFTGPHRDGWGIAYFEDRDVRLVKEARAAAESEWVRFIRDHDIRSQIVMAHIRRATWGERTYQNAQPFVREIGGRVHAFAHNGRLERIFEMPTMQPRRYRPVGETDSEWAFCALADRMSALWSTSSGKPSPGERASIVTEYAAELRSIGLANFLYSDGELLFAHSHRRKQAASGREEPPGLFALSRWCGKGNRGVVTRGLSVNASVEGQTIALIASVPLTDEPWEAIGEGRVLVVSQGCIVS